MPGIVCALRASDLLEQPGMVWWGGCQTKLTASVRGEVQPPQAQVTTSRGGVQPPQACVPTSRGGSRPKEEPRFEVAVGLTNNSRHSIIQFQRFFLNLYHLHFRDDIFQAPTTGAPGSH